MADTSYMARKSVADIVGSAGEEGSQALSKTLGATSITAMGIGAIIGAGIFVLTGTAAAQFAGPSIVLSFVLGGIACAFVGLCYSELAAMLPVCGSSYTYTYATLGEIFAWIIGWDLILEYAMGAATVAVGWSGYIVSLLHNVGISIPPTLAAAPGTVIKLADGTTATGIVNLPAILIIAILTTLLVLGTKESARLNNIMVAVKLTVVVAFIALGMFFIKPANWHPFIPANTGEFGNFGMSGILRGSAVVFFAFIGFDAVSTAAQEARRPQRDMPIGILGSLIICTVLYILVAGILTGLVPYGELNVPDPIAKGVDAIGLTWFSILIKIGALTGLTTVILVLLYGQSRIFFTMSKDGLLPPLFARVHPRLQTPHLSQILIGTIVAIVAALTPISVLGEMVSIGTLFAFILVCGAVIYLRRSDSDASRPFRVPAVPVVPILGILFCLLLMAGLPLVTWMRLVVWLVIGMTIYLSYGRHHSTLRFPERR
ncbi:amino acid permease [Paraburkholderia sartisoli]|uniref:Amino acid/polyamine/organocation transporter, APC superfamily n=1 Tax=Paraburkholderia sartisoli TaxID=83784 RepID=A0A1H4H8Y9_9BURK|nr:amino acid permease [Paraburkholderia sartisoli]SEB17548.1 amino acid/polyamine/organocation transporter, APC superfamily [Paraburkholderia sartisoli]